MAIKRSSSVVRRGLVDVLANLGNDGCAKGNVGNKVAVPTPSQSVRFPSPIVQLTVKVSVYAHDIDVQPVRALLHCARALLTKLCEVGRQDGRRNDCLGRHDSCAVMCLRV